MHFVRGFIRSILIGIIVTLAVWLISIQVFSRLDEQLPFFFAFIVTYFVAAYLLLPQLVHLGSLLFRNKKVPPYTHATDGLSSDPVNIVLYGTKQQLLDAFTSIGWTVADKLTPFTTAKMIIKFLQNKPYPTAPFIPLFLFGRKQDFGFQEPIGNSPRKRHHVRFWGANPENKLTSAESVLKHITDIKYWIRKQTFKNDEPIMWVGAGTKDIGFAFAKLTYQFSHKVDAHIDEERDHILGELAKATKISDIQHITSPLPVGRKFISDGQIVTAKLQ